MDGTQHRWDAWAQWAGIILLLLAAGWNLSGRLSRIEQQLADDAEYHKQETVRIEQLERDFYPNGFQGGAGRVSH